MSPLVILRSWSDYVSTGHDMVISTLGFPKQLVEKMTKFTESMTAILEAMKAGGVDRIITMSAWYTDPNTRQQLIHTISFSQIRDQRFNTN